MNDISLKIYSGCGSDKSLKLLLLRPSCDFNGGTWLFSRLPHISRECINILIEDPRIDPSFNNNCLFRLSCQYVWYDLVSRLLGHLRVYRSDNYCGQ